MSIAQKTLLTRVKHKYATLSEWMSSTYWNTTKTEKGELYIFEIAANDSKAASAGLNPSSTKRHMTKTGDGVSTLSVLPWDSADALIDIGASATDDDVVVLSGTAGVNEVSYSASHAKKGPTSGYTSGNTTTSIEESGASATLKIPQITVDTYGHVTAAADESVSIKMPTIPGISKATDTSTGTTNLTYGGTFSALTDLSASGHTLTDSVTTFKMPAETAITVDNAAPTEVGLTPAHAGTIDVVTNIAKGGTSHNIDVTTTRIKLPAETSLGKNTSGTETGVTLTVPKDTKKKVFNAMTSTTVSGHKITDKLTPFTIDLSNFATLDEISSAMVFKGTLGTGGTITALPTASATTVGDCYKVITAATYASTACTVGDMWVCNSTPAWVHIPSGDDEYKGTVTKVQAGQGLSTGTNPISTSGTISHVDSTRTNNTSTASPAHGGTFTAIDSVTTDTMGHISAVNTKTVTLPAQYSHPTYTARTGVPANNATLTHGGTFTVTQPVSNGTGHITAMNTRTYTLPSETSVSITNPNTDSASLSHSGTFVAVTGFSVTGHTITPLETTYTLPAHTDEKVGGVSTTTAAEYPLLFKNSTGTTTTAAKARFNSGITVNPSTKTITATTFAGNASTATKFNSARTVALTGDVTGSASNDGSGGWSVATTISAITTAEIEALFV